MVIKNYFAAANGYTGFRSYFGDIFNSNYHDHIYVIKGGPGTGKSTLMKKIAEKATKENTDHDKIFCSSDPSSLDGIIVRSERGRFAIIDGTSPHERDAVIPGAIDSIVNLGEGFDVKKLKECRQEIISLNERKKAAYKSAYDTLKVAGGLSNRIRSLLKPSFSYRKAELIIDDILYSHNKESGVGSIMLTNAFCKYGLYKLDSYSLYDRQYSLFGSHGEDVLFLNFLYDKSRQFVDCVSYSPLSKDDCDAIAIGDVAYTTTKSEIDASFDARELTDKNYSVEEISTLELMHDELLMLAKKHLSEASILHFELEKIYSSAVFFEKNDESFEKIISYIF